MGRGKKKSDEELLAEAIQSGLKTAKYWKYGAKCKADLPKCKSIGEVERCLEMGNYRKHSVEIAQDLLYPAEVAEKIWQAENEAQISNILIDARHASERKKAC